MSIIYVSCSFKWSKYDYIVLSQKLLLALYQMLIPVRCRRVCLRGDFFLPLQRTDMFASISSPNNKPNSASGRPSWHFSEKFLYLLYMKFD